MGKDLSETECSSHNMCNRNIVRCFKWRGRPTSKHRELQANTLGTRLHELLSGTLLGESCMVKLKLGTSYNSEQNCGTLEHLWTLIYNALSASSFKEKISNSGVQQIMQQNKRFVSCKQQNLYVWCCPPRTLATTYCYSVRTRCNFYQVIKWTVLTTM